MWVDLCPSKEYVECDLISKWDLCKHNQVKVRSLEWALIQYDCCSYERNTPCKDTDTQGEHHVMTEAETGAMLPQATD